MTQTAMKSLVETARAYVREADVPEAQPALLGAAETTVAFVLDKAKDQAAVVGSDVVAFVKGITPEQRTDIINASLLAQLVAKKKVADPQDLAGVIAWYDQYFEVLSNLGFVIQSKDFAEFVETGTGVEVHEAILDVAKVALGAAPTALALVTKTLESLKNMNKDSPWITLFQRESKTAKTARFQVTLTEPAEDGGLFVQLMAFGLEAKSVLTQVLFFKVKKNEATLQHHSGKITINTTVLGGVRAEIEEKLKKHTAAFVAGLDVD